MPSSANIIKEAKEGSAWRWIQQKKLQALLLQQLLKLLLKGTVIGDGKLKSILRVSIHVCFMDKSQLLGHQIQKQTIIIVASDSVAKDELRKELSNKPRVM